MKLTFSEFSVETKDESREVILWGQEPIHKDTNQDQIRISRDSIPVLIDALQRAERELATHE